MRREVGRGWLYTTRAQHWMDDRCPTHADMRGCTLTTAKWRLHVTRALPFNDKLVVIAVQYTVTFFGRFSNLEDALRTFLGTWRKGNVFIVFKSKYYVFDFTQHPVVCIDTKCYLTGLYSQAMYLHIVHGDDQNCLTSILGKAISGWV